MSIIVASGINSVDVHGPATLMKLFELSDLADKGSQYNAYPVWRSKDVPGSNLGGKYTDKKGPWKYTSRSLSTSYYKILREFQLRKLPLEAVTVTAARTISIRRRL
ncbi:hypothetical protein B0H11DRAFT_1940938 [Mycena galericulata]|nr:hypothetical protein B0H11DRAFT_1940938 [Mycena galericulata]